jgi:hypothetical protein
MPGLASAGTDTIRGIGAGGPKIGGSVAMNLPELSFEGALDVFQHDVGRQLLTLRLSGTTLRTGERITLKCLFSGVFYLQLATEVPIVISGENGCESIGERLTSELLDSVWVDKDGRMRLTNALQLGVVARPPDTFAARHFVVHSSFLHAEWLCKDLYVESEPFID